MFTLHGPIELFGWCVLKTYHVWTHFCLCVCYIERTFDNNDQMMTLNAQHCPLIPRHACINLLIFSQMFTLVWSCEELISNPVLGMIELLKALYAFPEKNVNYVLICFKEASGGWSGPGFFFFFFLCMFCVLICTLKNTISWLE